MTCDAFDMLSRLLPRLVCGIGSLEEVLKHLFQPAEFLFQHGQYLACALQFAFPSHHLQLVSMVEAGFVPK